MKNPRLKIFIGFDRREPLAYEVARYSIFKNVSDPEAVSVYPIVKPYLRELGLWWKPDDKMGSTEFSVTRFLTPYLAGFSGWALFVDCDFIFVGDILTILDHVDPDYPVSVTKHIYTPRNLERKMDGQKQYVLPKKNWSSTMLFNCGSSLVRALTPDYVNSADPGTLHRFEWLPNDNFIGELPLTYNWLAGETQYTREDLERYVRETNAPHIVKDGKIHPVVYHYTLGCVLFQAVSDDYKDKEKYPYLYDLMMEEVNPIFIQYAEELKQKPWEEILKEQREYLQDLFSRGDYSKG